MTNDKCRPGPRACLQVGRNACAARRPCAPRTSAGQCGRDQLRENPLFQERFTISLQRTFSHSRYYYLLFATAVLLVGVLGRFLVEQGYEFTPLTTRDYGLLTCATGSAAGPTLHILDAVYVEDPQLLSAWCRSSQVARHFGEVALRSTHRDHLDLRELFEARYQLILAKPELLQEGRRSIRRGVDYVTLARYPDYGAQLVSLAGRPELTRQWWQGKRLGLIDDPNSVSAFQIPKAALKNSGLEDVPEIVYFRTHRQLYRALFDGRVDVIPTLVSEEGPDSALQLPPGLVLEETIPGPAWYVHRDLLDTPAHCDLLAALAQLASTARVDFFRHFTVVRDCEAG